MEHGLLRASSYLLERAGRKLSEAESAYQGYSGGAACGAEAALDFRERFLSYRIPRDQERARYAVTALAVNGALQNQRERSA